MEIGFNSRIPTYSGGLGVLAGDMLRSAADLEIPVAAVTLVHHNGYFRQKLGPQGDQCEEPDVWHPEEYAELLDTRVSIQIEGRKVVLRAWRYWIRGISGHAVPVYLLDSAVDDNDLRDQVLTNSLYGGDQRYRLCQEAILGLGGTQMLEALGYSSISSYHMNEGHAALLALGLLTHELDGRSEHSLTDDDIESVRRKCVFTTHTPVPAGHDQFAPDLVRQVLGDELARVLDATRCCPERALNMTYLALRFSRYVNGVAMRHGEVTSSMFPRYPIHAITNGVHAITWTAPSFQELYDRYLPDWRYDNMYLRYAIRIPVDEIRGAHRAAKKSLFDRVKSLTGHQLNETALTIGFARRAAAYKRADLLFSDLERLRRIGRHVGPLQILYAGKAHPHDEGGKEMIRSVFRAAAALNSDTVRVIYLENYEMDLARLLTSGVDLWLNTPLRPQEASGTSGMKAALNGIPSLSVLDGWWIEGCHEGLTGWAIGGEDVAGNGGDSASLYYKLESVIAPMYYLRPAGFAEVMRAAISVNGSFFSTNRMLGQYLNNAYFPRHG